MVLKILKGMFSFNSWEGNPWLTWTLNLSGLKHTFQVEKDNTVVKRSIVYIVEGWFSFHSWEGNPWLTGTQNVSGLKLTFWHYYGLCTQKIFFFGLHWVRFFWRIPGVGKWIPRYPRYIQMHTEIFQMHTNLCIMHTYLCIMF